MKPVDQLDSRAFAARALPQVRHSIFTFRNRFVMSRILLATLVFLMLFNIPLSFGQGAAAPFLIPFQGKLTSPNDQPMAEGSHDIIFSLYNERSGGQPLWSERHAQVGVVEGQVNVFLGSVPGNAVPLNGLDFGTEKWLGIMVDTDAGAQPEMTPRQLLNPAFFALQARNSDKLQGDDWSALFPDGNPTGSIPGSRIAPGTVTNAQLSPSMARLQLQSGGVDVQLASSPVSPSLQGFGYVREAGGLIVGGTIFYAYRLDPNPVHRLTLAQADGVEFVDNQAAPLDFGDVSTPTAEVVLTVRNLGNREITDLSASVDGADPGDFTYSFGSSSVPVGGNTTLLVSFIRSSYGQRNAVIHVTASGLANPFDLGLHGTVGPPPGFAVIPAGPFTMGQTSGDPVSSNPPVTVTVSAFVMQHNETTKAEWDTIRAWGVVNGYADLAAGRGKAANHPVQMVKWWDVVKWCNARSQMEGLTPCYTVSGEVMMTGATEPAVNWTANGYRLPTEAEWEKAARGGVSGARYPWGTDTISHTQANYSGSGTSFGNLSTGFHPSYNDGVSPYTAPVGSFPANAYGLHDVSGNVREWVWDWFGDTYYTSGVTDPRGPSSGPARILRGGSYGDLNFQRCSVRTLQLPESSGDFYGFRSARSRP